MSSVVTAVAPAVAATTRVAAELRSGIGGAGGGGGTDFCADAISSCAVTSGAGTQTVAGSGAGFAQVTISYTLLPTSIAQCKNGGWKTFGSMFRNQGACVSFVTTAGEDDG